MTFFSHEILDFVFVGAVVPATVVVTVVATDVLTVAVAFLLLLS